MPPKKDGINLLEDAALIKELKNRKKRGLSEALRDARQVVLFCIFLGLFSALILTEPLGDFFAFEQSVRNRFDRIPPHAQATSQLSGGPGGGGGSGSGGGMGGYTRRLDAAAESAAARKAGDNGAAAKRKLQMDSTPRQGNKESVYRGDLISLQDVTSHDHLYQYLNTTLYHGIYIDPAEANTTANGLKLDMLKYNILIGSVQIRNVRVSPDIGCKLDAEYV